MYPLKIIKGFVSMLFGSLVTGYKPCVVAHVTLADKRRRTPIHCSPRYSNNVVGKEKKPIQNGVSTIIENVDCVLNKDHISVMVMNLKGKIYS